MSRPRRARAPATNARGFTYAVVAAAVAGAGAIGGRIAADRLAGVRAEPWPDFARAAAIDPAPLAIGPADAAVRVDIFGDYACPACARLEQIAGDSLRALARAGRLLLRHHHTPILRRRENFAHRVLACAGAAGTPWRAHAALFATASEWTRAADPTIPIIEYMAHAELDARPPARSGSARIHIEACLRSPRDDAGRRAAADAILAGIREVPVVAIDGTRIRYRRSELLLAHIVRRAVSD